MAGMTYTIYYTVIYYYYSTNTNTTINSTRELDSRELQPCDVHHMYVLLGTITVSINRSSSSY